MKEFYEVSWAEIGTEEWSAPESVLAASPQFAAEELIKEEFIDAERSFLGEWYQCHVSLGDSNWYYKVKPVRRVIVTEAELYVPNSPF
jgi:hypothetical protein